MKLALVYTSTTPELIALTEREVLAQTSADATLLSYQNPEILSEVRAAGYVTAAAAAALVAMYMQAIREGADAILNICSSVGEVADATQALAQLTGVPIVRIDEEMCAEAVRTGLRVAIMATLPTTLAPTKNTVLRLAKSFGKRVEIVECLVDGAFGLNREAFLSRMLCAASPLLGKCDVIVLAQGSMAYCETELAQHAGVPVLSSPRFGSVALRRALIQKGLLASRPEADA